MAFRSPHKLCLSLLVALLALAAGYGPLHADIKELKQDIKELEKDRDEAREDERDASGALDDNQNRQRKAEGEELKRLKRDAVDLASKLRIARENLAVIGREIAKKQSELRADASKTAADKVDAKGEAAKLVADAADALKIWSGALGELPTVPEYRSTDGMDDDEAHAQHNDDRKKIKTFIKWCDDEVARLDAEIGRADTVISNKLAGGNQLAKDASALKSRLQQRKKSVEALRTTADNRLKE